MTVVGVNTSGERDGSLRETEKRHECGTKPAHRSTAVHDHRATPTEVSGTVRAGESFQSQGLPIPAGRVAHAGVDRRRFVGASASIRARDRRRCRPAALRAKQAGWRSTGCLRSNGLTAARSRVPPPGTQLVKRYKKDTLTVTVLEDGYQYGERVYKSLSAIARQVTGTQWNGYLFFGLGLRQEQGRGE